MQEQLEAPVREIFTSIQGEGLYVGEAHIFVRFSRCNLNCAYCDTDYELKKSKKYNIDKLYKILSDINYKTISFTGGEPLMETVFLYNFLKKYKIKLNKKIYLETNGTMYMELEKIIDYIDIIAMDIKLESSSKNKNRFEDNDKFASIARKKEAFIKIVFNNDITNDEIKKSTDIAKKYDLPIVLQPEMPLSKELKTIEIFNKFYSEYNKVRLIVQTHKFLNLA